MTIIIVDDKAELYQSFADFQVAVKEKSNNGMCCRGNWQPLPNGTFAALWYPKPKE